jgi:hypothetical protein
MEPSGGSQNNAAAEQCKSLTVRGKSRRINHRRPTPSSAGSAQGRLLNGICRFCTDVCGNARAPEWILSVPLVVAAPYPFLPAVRSRLAPVASQAAIHMVATNRRERSGDLWSGPCGRRLCGSRAAGLATPGASDAPAYAATGRRSRHLATRAGKGTGLNGWIEQTLPTTVARTTSSSATLLHREFQGRTMRIDSWRPSASMQSKRPMATGTFVAAHVSVRDHNVSPLTHLWRLISDRRRRVGGG